MKFYLHLQNFDFTLLVDDISGKERIGDLVKYFTQRYNVQNVGQRLSSRDLVLRNTRNEVISVGSIVSEVIQNGEDVFVFKKGDEVDVKIESFENLIQSKLENKSNEPSTFVASEGKKDNKEQAQEKKELGNSFISKKEYSQAVKMYTEAIQLDPSQAIFFSNRALAYLELQKYQEVIDDCDKCLKLDPNNFKAYFRKGTAVFQLKRYEEALSVFKKGLNLKGIDKSFLSQFKKKIGLCEEEIKKQNQVIIQKPVLSREHSEYVKGALEIAKKAEEQRNYRHAITCYENILIILPNDLQSLLKLGLFWFYARKFDKSLEYYLLGHKHHPKEIQFSLLSGNCYMENKDYENAIKYFNIAIELATTTEEIRKIKVKLGDALYQKGDQPTAVNLWQAIIAEDENHFEALFSYGKALIDHAKIGDSLPVFIKLLVKDSNDQRVKDVLASLVQSEGGLQELLRLLGTIPRASSGYAYIANAIKEFSAVKEAIELYKIACSIEPHAPSYVLSLVHNYEVMNQMEEVYCEIKRFCKENPNMTVGQRSCAHIYNVIANYSTPNTLQDKEVKLLPVKESQAPPLSQMYDHDTLELLAIWCTLTKIVYLAGNLELAKKIVDVIHPTREGREIHTTSIRNEHAYNCCIAQLMVYHTIPNNLKEKKRIYVAGDSHSLVTAWQPIVFRGEEHQIEPLLVTGCKCWHLRPESKFFPKVNFWKVVTTAPHGSTVIFQFGEIDCREGLIMSVQKCVYKDIEEGVQVVVDIYINVLLEVHKQKGYNIYVHPAPPVIDVTREIVRTFNATLKEKLKNHAILKFLDFEQDLLDPQDNSNLNPKFTLDGTHMNPLYISSIERELKKYE